MMLELGTMMPSFNLPNTDGNCLSSCSLASPLGVLVIFICNHCPYVIHIQKALVEVSNQLIKSGLDVVAINSNDSTRYQDDSQESMRVIATKLKFPFPYLFDQSQSIAKAFHATCTPDCFLFCGLRKLYYRGQFDSSRPGNEIQPSGTDIKYAVRLLLEGASAPETQLPSMGCNIKWREGNEPDHFL